RNHVAREARRPARRAAAGSGEQRIADEDQPALAVEGLREVSLALERGGNPPLIDVARIGAAEDILRPEEEQLVAALVEVQAGEQHRAAHRPRFIVELVERRLALRGLAEGALLLALELVAVQLRV